MVSTRLSTRVSFRITSRVVSAALPSRVLALALLSAVTVASFGSLGACGSSDSSNGGGGDPTGDGGLGADGQIPPTRADHGIDARPVNTTCKAPARPPSTAPVTFEPVFANVDLGLPMMIAQIPGDPSRWFVAERGGAIVSFQSNNPGNQPTAVGTLTAVSGKNINLAGEGGFLGFAFHPNFATNGKLYVTWTTTGGGTGMQSEVGVLHSPDNGASFDTYETVLGPFPQPATNHNGGGIAFGKDGYLYLSFGDGGGGDDTYINGQKKTSFFSKILRIDIDDPADGNKYGIPADNPFKNGGGEPATFAMGFRNPFRISVDRESNEVWVADVGQNRWEEVNAKVKVGGNYGWPCREAMHVSPNAMNTAKCPPGTSGLIDPIIEHEHVPNNSRSITGGVVYRGKAVPDFVGSYVYGDYEKQELWTISYDPSTGEPKSTQLSDGPTANWVSFAEDNDGEVYAVALNQGRVYKLVASAPAGPNTFPDLLSKTGCVDPSDPKQPASGLIPYGVNAQLWSDGAAKERFMALPEGATITVKAEDGDFDFPNGTVLVKTFLLGGKRIETRLFMRHDDGGWAGYTYEWRDDESDAVLLRGSKTKTVGAQTWAFPSRGECINCHSEAAGSTLGLELGQLNGDFTYTSTNRLSNQLRTLEHIGVFSAPLGEPIDQLIAFPDPLGSGPLEARARAYLHSNCSNCHRPEGPGRGNLDLRFGTSLADTKSCNVNPEGGDLGVAGAKLLVPGAPAQSLISLRPHSLGSNRMPPLASTVVDEDGVKVIDDYITSLTACP